MERTQVGGQATSFNTLVVSIWVLTAATLIVGALSGAKVSASPLTESGMLFAALVFYGAASVLYLAYGVTANPQYARAPRFAAAAGLLANTGAVLLRWYEAGHPPFSSVYEMLLSFVWTLAALNIFAEWKYKVRILGAITMPLAALSVVLMQLLPSAVKPLVPALQSTWLHIHVSLAMLAYAACALSFGLALMYLVKDHMETETFLAWISGMVALSYGGMLTRFYQGGLQVAAWEVHDGSGHEMRLADNSILMVVIPELGWLIGLGALVVAVPLVIYAWHRLRPQGKASAWMQYATCASLLMQAVAAAVFVLRADAGMYPAVQVPGRFETALGASPFIISGLVGGIAATTLGLLLSWRRDTLELMMPSADALDRYTYKAIGIGFPLLTLMIAAGAYWANRTWGSYWSWDPKETWAAITWLVYAVYLHMRIARGWRGRRAAYFALLGFAVVLFTFFGVTYLLPGLHAYS